MAAFIPASAFAVEVVRSPLTGEGDLRFDYIGKYQWDENPHWDNYKEQNFSGGYGVTDFWRTRVETEFVDKQSQGLDFKSLSTANMLAITGKDSFLPTSLFLDATLSNHLYLRNYAMAGLASQISFGPVTNIANLFVKHEFGYQASGKPSLIYRYQFKYDLYDYFKPGVEVYGDTNKQQEFQHQQLKIGPAIFGDITPYGQKLSYTVELLLGATHASPDGTIQWRLCYAFQ